MIMMRPQFAVSLSSVVLLLAHTGSAQTAGADAAVPASEGAPTSDRAADPGADDAAGAEPDAAKESIALFNEGRRLMAAGDYDAACSTFERSIRLETRVGALMNFALCLSVQKKYASAYLRYLEAGDLAV